MKSLLDLITPESLINVENDEKGLEEVKERFNKTMTELYATEEISKIVKENQDLKDHIHDLNNKLLNLQLFLKDLRDSFHKEDETYEEIDKKLKELGG